ncbi:4Fe-4S dicluster domain-containing protein [Candidatus Thorarchaeota archaeon]|nr:MAG: 4Fe-4S dicluster domain-containing protein [Candidatus Thorarchaeota archaeon]
MTVAEGWKKMKHILTVDVKKCTGCRNCELACSVEHYRLFNPSRSRIKVIKNENKGIILPMVCLQCEEPLCQEACPTGAIRPNSNGTLYVVPEICIGCGSCVTACIYGGISIDPVTKKAAKCDLCEGNPACMKACEYGAIEYVEFSEGGLLNRKRGIEPVAKMQTVQEEI